MEEMKISVCWLRRDLRLEDNTALSEALSDDLPTLLLFIFDENILSELPLNDPRVGFIHETLQSINNKLSKLGSSILCLKGDPISIWTQLVQEYPIGKVYLNKDYEPYAMERDSRVSLLLEKNGIQVQMFKDQVIFEQDEIIKDDSKPYTVFSPYQRKWLEKFKATSVQRRESNYNNFFKRVFSFPALSVLGFQKSTLKVPEFDLSCISNYGEKRNFPWIKTTFLGPHLRFGTISIRQLVSQLGTNHSIFLSELIWREFFMQILYHFPHVVNRNFKPQYDGITWRNNEKEFERWCNGDTGYPLVDAGMRQLNATGFMHNRVRMVTASFLCKHLLVDWRWGEEYFAKKLLDYELSSNNGNWQWAAGTGCDAAPYFRVFNPIEQQRKFDPDFIYIKEWLPEYEKPEYPAPIVEHAVARKRALDAYKKGLTPDTRF